jgi:ferric-dicitrate binding protein FerR (iron transport regulator)
MPIEQSPFHISSLIARKLASEITEDEESELDAWINASPVNKAIYETTIDPKTKIERDSFVQSLNVQSDWLTVQNKLPASKAGKHVQMYWLRVAAAVLVVAVALGVIFFQWERPQTKEAFEQEVARITPGTPQATVTLHNGQTILLSEVGNQNKLFEEANGAGIYNANGSVAYREGQSESKDVIYNEINVPRGGEYKLVLADGTQVWLNSETRLKFPVEFNTNERVVELSGEAYFEVAHNIEKPFIVTTLSAAKIQVYGTSFNVNAYADSRAVAVTLSEGKVSVRSKNTNEKMLAPDQQALVTDGETISIRDVDASAFSAWKDGLLVFDNLSMGEISHLLSRWYNVEFEFENESIKDLRFSADIKRYATFRDVLEIFERTGQLSFEVHGKKIKVINRTDV